MLENLVLVLLHWGILALSVINALMVLLVSSLVRGFKVSGFWTAYYASIFISILSFLVGYAISGGETGFQPSSTHLWV